MADIEGSISPPGLVEALSYTSCSAQSGQALADTSMRQLLLTRFVSSTDQPPMRSREAQHAPNKPTHIIAALCGALDVEAIWSTLIEARKSIAEFGSGLSGFEHTWKK